MSKQEKLSEKLLNPQTVMTWQELATLLRGLGYRQIEGSGSRVKFDNGNPLASICLHRPHPGNELKAYVKRLVAEHLKEGGMIR
ncbi:MAG: type II toxin-antitoxin system HicA family toxin [Betaproteobacteria bacterium]|nr:type II toxin-antitoxin system HicA family toxin [Betaproteobacteria bacterium]